MFAMSWFPNCPSKLFVDDLRRTAVIVVGSLREGFNAANLHELGTGVGLLFRLRFDLYVAHSRFLSMLPDDFDRGWRGVRILYNVFCARPVKLSVKLAGAGSACAEGAVYAGGFP